MASDTESTAIRNKAGLALLAATVGFLVIAIVIAQRSADRPRSDPDNAQQVAQGKAVYDRYCAACHGMKLEGQPNWRDRLPTGRMLAPPHDASGHTWHHPDSVLFGITKHGLVPGKYAPPGHQSDMPAFGAILADSDIHAVLAYIKSRWPAEIRRAQLEISQKAERK